MQKRYVLTPEGAELLKKLKLAINSNYFPKGEQTDSIKESIHLLENNCAKASEKVMNIFLILSHFSKLQVDEKKIKASKSLHDLQAEVAVYEEIRSLEKRISKLYKYSCFYIKNSEI